MKSKVSRPHFPESARKRLARSVISSRRLFCEGLGSSPREQHQAGPRCAAQRVLTDSQTVSRCMAQGRRRISFDDVITKTRKGEQDLAKVVFITPGAARGCGLGRSQNRHQTRRDGSQPLLIPCCWMPRDDCATMPLLPRSYVFSHGRRIPLTKIEGVALMGR